MKLSYEQIKDITRGAENIKIEEGEYRFFRFNDKELDFYKTSPFHTKAYATSDVEMVFETDATTLSIKGVARVAVSYRTWYTLEVFSNSERIGTVQNYEGDITNDVLFNEFRLGDFEASFSLGEGRKTVRIVFPQFVALSLRELELVGATFISAVKPKIRMFFYGDSITQGYDAQYPSGKYTALTARLLGAEAYNKAIGGEVFHPELAAVKSKLEPDYICVAYGTNDTSTDLETFINNSYAFYFNLAKNYPNAKIFALSPIWRLGYDKAWEIGSFTDVEKQIKRIASELKNVIFIRGFDFVPHEPKYFTDGHLHPSNEGFILYAENLAAAIKEHI